MGLIVRAAHSVFGDRVPSNEERVLAKQARRLRRLTKWANRLAKDTAATRMLNQQTLQMQLAHETIREQRYRRLVALYSTKACGECKVAKYSSRADCSRSITLQLQQQLATYQSPQQYAQYAPVGSPSQYSDNSQQQQQSWDAVAAMPISMQSLSASQPLPPPPAYSGPAFAHYPNVSQYQAAAGSFSPSATPSSSTSHRSSHVSIYSSYSERGSLQEPWLSAGEKQTMR